MSELDKPVPEVTIDSAGYWEAARRGELLLSRCTTCQHAFHYPRPMCPACGAWTIDPFVASGRGEVHSFTVVYRAPGEAFRADVPYVLALVDTEEGARLFTAVRDVDPSSVRIGLAVQVAFEPRGEFAIPVFVPG